MALISKASLLMVPSTYEQEKLYNVLPSGNRAPDSTDQNSGYDQTRADFTFDRGSNAAATRVNADGLIEKYRENLLTESNNFSDSDWVKNSTTVTSGQSGYDGSANAWLIAATGSQYARVQQNVTTSGVNTLSAYMKKGTLNYGILYIGATSNVAVYVDLENGTIPTIQGSSLVIDYTIKAVQDGWYRVSITTNQSIFSARIYPNDSGTTYGTPTGNILIQNAQLETGLVATDYLDSGATTAKAGVLIDLPRINYDANGENGALLLEPSRQQLYQYSEYSGVWNKTNWTTTDNYAISPEGVKNAFRAVSTNNSGILYMSGTGTPGQKNTLSVWAKSNTGSDQKFRFFTDGNTNTSSDFVATTEWQRFEYTHDCNFVTAGIKGASSELSDILFYGFQQEAGSYATSYIPNHGTSGGVTRAADSITSGTITAPLSGGYTAFIEFETQSTSVYNQIQFRETAANYVFRVGNQINVGAGSTIQTNTTGMNKFALQVSSGGAYELFKNGSSVATGTGITHDIELIKTDLAGQGVKQIAVFNEALTDAECITLTTL